ncbi:c-type cytochrome [Gammaproteobacteria bacterium]|nr:c-type cytochrome [Gammaproteobacteria bacterium]
MSKQKIFGLIIALIILFFGVQFLMAPPAEVEPNPVVHLATYPEVDFSKSTDPELAKKGLYLTKLGDCIACHTDTDGKPFAGGRSINSPFGDFYSPNITSDKTFGIGAWTYDDFKNAMRHGVSPEGSNYYPVFPYAYYTKVTDDDLKALKAYFDLIPAVAQENKPHDVGFPFNIRFLVTGWNMLFFYPYQGVFAPDDHASDKMNRGEYLVEGLAHCGMCHTPINFLGGPKRWMAYTGNTIDGWYAPNITGTNLKSVSEDKLARVFVYGEKPGGGQVQGPMREVNHDSLEYIQQEDLHAIAAYIKSTKDPVPMAGGQVGADADALVLGKTVYDAKCAACHNMGAGGSPKITDQAAWLARRDKKGIDQLYDNVYNGINAMPARGLCNSKEDDLCDDNSMRSAVDYIYSLQTGDQKKADRVGQAPKPVTVSRAKTIYDQTCSTCHSEGQLSAPKLGDQKAWNQRLKSGFDVLVHNVIKGYVNTGNEGACVVEKGGCHDCTDAEIIAVVKYMLDQSVQSKNFKLW